MINTVATIGGIFAVMTFTHFFVDWVFQSHDDAMAKSTNGRIRSNHCLIYALGFVPMFMLLHTGYLAGALYLVILYVSHFFEDTYLPVLWWMKHIRRVPVFFDKTLMTDNMPMSDVDRLKLYLGQGPLGYILLITIDQIIHLFFVLIVAILIVW